jgi:hypothetical protein
VAKRAAERPNGAQFVLKAKLARLTWGTPEWSSPAEEEYVHGDVHCSSPERSNGDDSCGHRASCRNRHSPKVGCYPKSVISVRQAAAVGRSSDRWPQ